MEHIGKVLDHGLVPSNASNAQPPNGRANAASTQKASDGAQRAARVWRAMTQMYGPAFSTAYGENPNPLWEAAIAKLTDDQCRTGLTKLAQEARSYPANLTEFVAACTRGDGVRYLGGPSSMYDPKRLEVQRASTDHVNTRLANIRRALGRPDGGDGA